MNEMALFGDKRMTVKEVAEALGVAPVTVNQNDLMNIHKVNNATIRVVPQIAAWKALI